MSSEAILLGQAKSLPAPSPCAKSPMQSMLGYYGRHRPRNVLFYFLIHFDFYVIQWNGYCRGCRTAISKWKYLLNSLFELEHFPTEDPASTEDGNFTCETKKRKYEKGGTFNQRTETLDKLVALNELSLSVLYPLPWPFNTMFWVVCSTWNIFVLRTRHRLEMMTLYMNQWRESFRKLEP